MLEDNKVKLTNSKQQFLNFKKSRAVKIFLLLQTNKVNKVNNLSFYDTIFEFYLPNI